MSPKKEVRMYGCASTASILHGCLLEVVRVYACSNISEREKKRKTKRLKSNMASTLAAVIETNGWINGLD